MAASVLCAILAFMRLAHAIHVDFDERIVNGHPTTADAYPFIVDIRSYWYYEWAGGFVSGSWCTGSLIRLEPPATILTAAHCLWNTTTQLGVYLLRSDADANHSSLNNYTFHVVSNYTIHEAYNHSSTDNDIALMFLDEDLSSNPRLGVVNITDEVATSGECCANHDAVRVIGYGADYSGGPPTDTLEYSDGIYITRDECNQRFSHYYAFLDVCLLTMNITQCDANYTLGDFAYNSDFPDSYDRYGGITENMICAIGDNTDSCQGDSGGPLIRTGTNIQVGVTSWGIGCAFGLPGVYTNLFGYRAWLNEHAGLDLEVRTPSPTAHVVTQTSSTIGSNTSSTVVVDPNGAQRSSQLHVACMIVAAALYLAVI